MAGEKRRTARGGRGPDVSNEYLIANPRHFQRIPLGSPRNECGSLSTPCGPPRALWRTDAMPRWFPYPRVLPQRDHSCVYAETRDSFRGEREKERAGCRKNTFTFDRRDPHLPNFMSRPRGPCLGRNSRKNKRAHWQIKLLFRDIPLNLLLPNLHA